VARQELALAARQREEEALARVDSVSRSGFQQELFRTLQDMTAFFDQLVVGKTLEPLLRPPSAAAAGRGEMSEGRGGDMRAQTRRHAGRRVVAAPGAGVGRGGGRGVGRGRILVVVEWVGISCFFFVWGGWETRSP